MMSPQVLMAYFTFLPTLNACAESMNLYPAISVDKSIEREMKIVIKVEIIQYGRKIAILYFFKIVQALSKGYFNHLDICP